MKIYLITIPLGALIFYFSYLGAAQTIYFAIDLLFESEEKRNLFISSNTFSDIAAFTGVIVPTFLCAFYTSLIDIQRNTKTAFFVAIGSMLFLFIIITDDIYTVTSIIRWSDVVAFIAAFPIAWFGVIIARALPNN